MRESKITSHVSFLYFSAFEPAREFFANTLGLTEVFNPGWACVWRVAGQSFIGAVDARKGTIQEKGSKGFLTSLTVDSADAWHERLSPLGLQEMTEVKAIPELGLKSFFFVGPEGYHFEIQEFTTPELRKIF